MKRLIVIAAVVLLMLSQGVRADQAADDLATAVMKASGSEHWSKVKVIRWTFAGRNKHVWNLKDNTDTITTGDKTATVKVNAQPMTPEDKKLMGAWTNDSYWLIAPLKIKDPGVMLSTLPDEMIEGKTYRGLHLAFKDVGMTPGDQYNFYIDPDTMLLRYWDYMPNANKKTRMSWDGYQDFKGVKIATEHKTQGSDKKLVMSDVSVEFE